MLYPVSPPWKVIVWGLVNSSVETIHVEIQHSPAMSRKTPRRIALEIHNRGQHCWPLSFHQTTAGRACHWETVRWTASHVRPWFVGGCGGHWSFVKFVSKQGTLQNPTLYHQVLCKDHIFGAWPFSDTPPFGNGQRGCCTIQPLQYFASNPVTSCDSF